jgi:hypothetical protein
VQSLAASTVRHEKAEDVDKEGGAGGVKSKSRPRYLLAMHDSELPTNSDESVSHFALPGGGWRPINLLLPPFRCVFYVANTLYSRYRKHVPMALSY